jgi:hypothetical protein
MVRLTTGERRVAGDVVAPEPELGHGVQHPLDQFRGDRRLLVDDPGDRLETHPGVAGDVDHRRPSRPRHSVA